MMRIRKLTAAERECLARVRQLARSRCLEAAGDRPAAAAASTPPGIPGRDPPWLRATAVEIEAVDKSAEMMR